MIVANNGDVDVALAVFKMLYFLNAYICVQHKFRIEFDQ